MRIELIHPMIVHFPLALLFTGVGFKVVGFFLRNRRVYRYVKAASWMVLSLGVCFAWLAILSGELAHHIEEKHLCEAAVLDQHALFAYTTAFLFTAALLLDLGGAWRKTTHLFSNKAVAAIKFFLFLSGTLLLIFTGVFGGILVFEQGVAVEKCCKVSKI